MRDLGKQSRSRSRSRDPSSLTLLGMTVFKGSDPLDPRALTLLIGQARPTGEGRCRAAAISRPIFSGAKKTSRGASPSIVR